MESALEYVNICIHTHMIDIHSFFGDIEEGRPKILPLALNIHHLHH